MVASINLQILLRLRPYPMRGHRLLCKHGDVSGVTQVHMSGMEPKKIRKLDSENQKENMNGVLSSLTIACSSTLHYVTLHYMTSQEG
jgi:hypothetical protein